MIQLLRNACVGTGILSQEACIGIFELNTPIRTYLNKLNPNHWKVLSYNSVQREICISVSSFTTHGKQVGTIVLSLTIPSVTS